MQVYDSRLTFGTSNKEVFVTIAVNIGNRKGGSLLGKFVRNQSFVIKIIVAVLLMCSRKIGIKG